MIRRDLVVHGRVQGVGFRWACAREARSLGLHGWVRNRTDGTVEIAVEGAAQAVERLVAWAHHGPRHASVEGVEVTEAPVEGLGAFRIA